MQIIAVPAGILRANSYLVSEDGKDAVLIDCGGREPLSFAAARGLHIRAVLLTHGHFDHVGGCAAAQRAGICVGAPEGEKGLLASPMELSAATGVPTEAFTPDFTYADGDVLTFCGMRFTVLATPGHTPGSVCFLTEEALFTGDTLFCGGVGRTDLPGGSAALLRQSLHKLFALAGDLTVYPGHGEATSLDHERRYDPFL